MLDECKGDKLEEVLVSWSSAVLAKVLAAERNRNSSVARRLVLNRKIALKDQESFLPLAVAHRASLTAVLRRKEQLRTRYSDFQHCLDQKEQDLARRTERLEEIEESGAARVVPNHVTQRIRRQFDIHWQGDPRWVDILVKGGEHKVRDPLLETEFSELWPLLNQGTVDKATATDQEGLLQDLEKKIISQRVRLQHWKALKDDLTRESNPTSSAKRQGSRSGKVQGIELGLIKPKDIVINQKKLYIGEKGQGMADRSCAPFMTDEYARLVDSMQAELTIVGKGAGQNAKSPKRKRNSIFPVPLTDRDKITRSDDLEILEGNSPQDLDTPTTKTSQTPYRPSLESPSHHTNGGDNKTLHRPISDYSSTLRKSTEVTGLRVQDAVTVNRNIDLSSRNASETQEDSVNPEVLDEDELLAQQIICSTRNAPPSTAKYKRCLVERTRQSMGFPTVAPCNEIHHLEPPLMLPPPSSTLDSSSPLPSKTTTLSERTRQSMSLMPSTSLKPRKSLHKPRPSRTYPTNQFETPSKQQVSTNVAKEETPPEKLFAQEADYTSVFKSRPKIALSPTVSPELREVKETDKFDDSFAENDVSKLCRGSPSMRRAGRVGRF